MNVSSIFQMIFWLISSTIISASNETKVVVNRENSKDIAKDYWQTVADDALCSSDGDTEVILKALNDWANSEDVQWFVFVGKLNCLDTNITTWSNITSFAYSYDPFSIYIAHGTCGYNMVVYQRDTRFDYYKNCPKSAQTKAQQLINEAALNGSDPHDVLRRIEAGEDSFNVERIFVFTFIPGYYKHSSSLYKNCSVENSRVFYNMHGGVDDSEPTPKPNMAPKPKYVLVTILVSILIYVITVN